MIKMGFLEHFQEYNQTPENIFQNIFWNATKHLKIFSFAENILEEPNTTLMFRFLKYLAMLIFLVRVIVLDYN